MDRAIAALHDKELAALRARVAELEAALREVTEGVPDGEEGDGLYWIGHGTYLRARTALAKGGDGE